MSKLEIDQYTNAKKVRMVRMPASPTPGHRRPEGAFTYSRIAELLRDDFGDCKDGWHYALPQSLRKHAKDIQPMPSFTCEFPGLTLVFQSHSIDPISGFDQDSANVISRNVQGTIRAGQNVAFFLELAKDDGSRAELRAQIDILNGRPFSPSSPARQKEVSRLVTTPFLVEQAGLNREIGNQAYHYVQLGNILNIRLNGNMGKPYEAVRVVYEGYQPKGGIGSGRLSRQDLDRNTRRRLAAHEIALFLSRDLLSARQILNLCERNKQVVAMRGTGHYMMIPALYALSGSAIFPREFMGETHEIPVTSTDRFSLPDELESVSFWQRLLADNELNRLIQTQNQDIGERVSQRIRTLLLGDLLSIVDSFIAGYDLGMEALLAKIKETESFPEITFTMKPVCFSK